MIKRAFFKEGNRRPSAHCRRGTLVYHLLFNDFARTVGVGRSFTLCFLVILRELSAWGARLLLAFQSCLRKNEPVHCLAGGREICTGGFSAVPSVKIARDFREILF